MIAGLPLENEGMVGSWKHTIFYRLRSANLSPKLAHSGCTPAMPNLGKVRPALERELAAQELIPAIDNASGNASVVLMAIDAVVKCGQQVFGLDHSPGPVGICPQVQATANRHSERITRIGGMCSAKQRVSKRRDW